MTDKELRVLAESLRGEWTVDQPDCDCESCEDKHRFALSATPAAVIARLDRIAELEGRLATVEAAANALRSKWGEGGCITEPPCGSCAWCDFVKALDGSEGGG